MIDVGDAVGKRHRDPFQRGRLAAFGVVEDAVPHLQGEIQPCAVLFQHVDDAHRLFAVTEPRGGQLGEHAFAHVPERRMAEIVPQSDRLGKIFIEGKATRERTGDLADVQRMRQAGDVMIPVGRKEDLRLVFETQERFGINDAVAVALKIRAHGARRFFAQPARAFRRLFGIRA